MKELLAQASNLSLMESDKGLVPIAEVILVLCEPVYSIDPSGGTIRSSAVEQVRFSSGPIALRKAAGTLKQLADDMEAMAARYSRVLPPERGGDAS